MKAIARIGSLSPQEFALLGLQDVAYVKAVSSGDGPSFAIHAADGTEIATAADRNLAFAMVRQNDLEPLSVH